MIFFSQGEPPRIDEGWKGCTQRALQIMARSSRVRPPCLRVAPHPGNQSPGKEHLLPFM